MWNPFNRLHKRQIEHRPAPAPKARRVPAVATTQTHRSIHLNVSLFNWYRGHTPRPPAPGRRLTDLPIFDRLFGKRPAAPPSVARVQAANRRADAARARTEARQQVKRQPPPTTSRPATAADRAELRRLQRERAKVEAQQARDRERQQQAAPTVVEGEVVEDKPVPVRRHTRDGHTVRAHKRDKPGEGDST